MEEEFDQSIHVPNFVFDDDSPGREFVSYNVLYFFIYMTDCSNLNTYRTSMDSSGSRE